MACFGKKIHLFPVFIAITAVTLMVTAADGDVDGEDFVKKGPVLPLPGRITMNPRLAPYWHPPYPTRFSLKQLYASQGPLWKTWQRRGYARPPTGFSPTTQTFYVRIPSRRNATTPSYLPWPTTRPPPESSGEDGFLNTPARPTQYPTFNGNNHWQSIEEIEKQEIQEIQEQEQRWPGYYEIPGGATHYEKQTTTPAATETDSWVVNTERVRVNEEEGYFQPSLIKFQTPGFYWPTPSRQTWQQQQPYQKQPMETYWQRQGQNPGQSYYQNWPTTTPPADDGQEYLEQNTQAPPYGWMQQGVGGRGGYNTPFPYYQQQPTQAAPNVEETQYQQQTQAPPYNWMQAGGGDGDYPPLEPYYRQNPNEKVEAPQYEQQTQEPLVAPSYNWMQPGGYNTPSPYYRQHPTQAAPNVEETQVQQQIQAPSYSWMQAGAGYNTPEPYYRHQSTPPPMVDNEQVDDNWVRPTPMADDPYGHQQTAQPMFTTPAPAGRKPPVASTPDADGHWHFSTRFSPTLAMSGGRRLPDSHWHYDTRFPPIANHQHVTPPHWHLPRPPLAENDAEKPQINYYGGSNMNFPYWPTPTTGRVYKPYVTSPSYWANPNHLWTFSTRFSPHNGFPRPQHNHTQMRHLGIDSHAAWHFAPWRTSMIMTEVPTRPPTEATTKQAATTTTAKTRDATAIASGLVRDESQTTAPSPSSTTVKALTRPEPVTTTTTTTTATLNTVPIVVMPVPTSKPQSPFFWPFSILPPRRRSNPPPASASDRQTTKAISMSTFLASSLDCGRNIYMEKEKDKYVAIEQPGIIGGLPARPNEFPWQVRLNYRRGFLCGGSVISSRHVLTAAHCIVTQNPTNYQIVIGDRSSDAYTDEAEIIIDVKKVIVHPLYNDKTSDFDLALLETSSNMIINSSFVESVCLPDKVSGPATPDEFVDKVAIVTGWGKLHEGGRAAPVLQKGVVPIMPQSDCNGVYENTEVTENMMCAGVKGGGIDTCQGDSGGPLIVLAPNNRFYVQGVTSWGYGCARSDRPGVYARVAKSLEWILKAMA